MKKIISLAIALILLLSLFAGCAGSGSSEPSGAQSKQSPLLDGYKWSDGVIVVDGVLYRSHYDPYSSLVENRWTTRQIFEYTLEGKTAVTVGLEHTNEKFGGKDGPTVEVDFYNPTKDPLPYRECNIDGIEVNAICNGVPYDESFDFELPGGVRRGCSIEDIKAAYGEPDKTEDDYDGYQRLLYKSDDPELHLYLCVYAEGGLQRVDISDRRFRHPE